MKRFLPETMSRKVDASLAEDLLDGAGQIAEFLLGDRAKRRRVYHWVETNQIPVFRMGTGIWGRRSTLLAWIAEQERQGCAASGQEAACAMASASAEQERGRAASGQEAAAMASASVLRPPDPSKRKAFGALPGLRSSG